jgi:AcrR family transcriptional regulator
MAGTPTIEGSWTGLAPTARRLLAAAIVEFGEHGYHGTSTRAVATRAGMSPAAMYMHFPTKEELLYEISRTGHEVVVELVRQAGEGAADPVERVCAIVTAMVRFHADHHGVARIIQYEHMSLTPAHQREMLRLRRVTESVLQEAIDQGVLAGRIEATAAPMATLAIMSLAIDVARWFPTQRSRRPAQIAEAYTVLALRMLGAART